MVFLCGLRGLCFFLFGSARPGWEWGKAIGKFHYAFCIDQF